MSDESEPVVRFHHTPPQLHDVADPDRVAVFNPEECASGGEWIQIDRRFAISGEDCQ